ncbi:MAG: alkaline phosphatase family protein [Deltaproteobacteria bacterium]|nr:alkaline phosphatase family protein [Deltaproteobacteria bacterium]
MCFALKNVLAVALAAFTSGCGLRDQGLAPRPPVPMEPARVEHVILLSIDGGKPTVIRGGSMPLTTRRAEEGASSWEARTVFPSITLVSHTSMLTGLTPERHRVDWNSWRPEAGPVAIPTVFELLERQGHKTALFATKEKLRHLDRPGTIAHVEIAAQQAKLIAEAAARHILAHRPSFVFVHFSEPDLAGHSHGWGSEAQRSALLEVDQAIAVLERAVAEAKIADQTVFLVTADHGGHDRTHGHDTRDDMTIPWIAFGSHVRRGHQLRELITTYDTAATVLWLLGAPVPSEWDGRPVTSAFTE